MSNRDIIQASQAPRRREIVHTSGPIGVSSINWSDPVVWAAKLAYEKFVAGFGGDGARAIAVYQRVKADLDLNPERGDWARKLVRLQRFFRGALRVLTCRIYIDQFFFGEPLIRESLAHAWRSRVYVRPNDSLLDWDMRRDLLLDEISPILKALASIGVSIEQLSAHAARLATATVTAPVGKPAVNYAARNEGFMDARVRGKKLTDNPYPPDSVEYRSWAKGWKQGVPAHCNRD